jgi:hypothetical protein
MNIFERLSTLSLPEDTDITLTYSQGTEVFVHNETAVDTAIADTDVISQFADLVATPRLQAEVPYVGNVLETMREEGFLDDYERGSFAFEDFISEVIHGNFYDQQFIDSSVRQYDHKRGFCTLESTVTVPLTNLLDTRPLVYGWTVSVNTPAGTLILTDD